MSSNNQSRINSLTEVITRYNNGAVKEFYYKDSENKLQGHYKRFYENGEMCISCSYVDGKRVGRCLEFEENGKFPITLEIGPDYNNLIEIKKQL
jgi:antitoxin component YwqK of YwqJK toxin-antitoxin module